MADIAPVAEADYADFAPNLTAHRPVNCIPHVCAAKPGFITTAALSQVIAGWAEFRSIALAGRAGRRLVFCDNVARDGQLWGERSHNEADPTISSRQ